MFVQASSNVQKRSTSDDLEDITKLCEPKASDVQELALDVVSKMVESWLDPTNVIQEQPCACRQDVLDHIGTLCRMTVPGPTLDRRQKSTEKRSKEPHDQSQSDRATCNGNEKRPRCNTGDKTASRGPSDRENDNRKTASEYFDLVALHLPIILRLCFACPFGRVREKCRSILELVRKRELPAPVPMVLGPSSFIQPSQGNARPATDCLSLGGIALHRCQIAAPTQFPGKLSPVQSGKAPPFDPHMLYSNHPHITQQHFNGKLRGFILV
ncbi:hypothetical protein HUJ04_008922 [Dendroctonus ponderosae]|nr:hypothetical protein HUJ04_008922 [Dendroctonus ponderosae]